jgi:hypothetical protein
MSILSSLTSAQLKRAAEVQEQIEALNLQLAGLLGNSVSAPVLDSAPGFKPARKKSKFTAEGLARLRAAQKARWARVHAAAQTEKAEPAKKRRKMSAAGRAKIAAAAKARWAKVRAEKGGK